MNKEKEALLKKILEAPDVPRKVSMKSIMRLLERMQPETEEMREYLIAFYSSETVAESRAIHDAKYASMTPAEAKVFHDAYHRCVENDLNIGKKVELV
jgi:hypothetical protein